MYVNVLCRSCDLSGCRYLTTKHQETITYIFYPKMAAASSSAAPAAAAAPESSTGSNSGPKMWTYEECIGSSDKHARRAVEFSPAIAVRWHLWAVGLLQNSSLQSTPLKSSLVCMCASPAAVSASSRRREIPGHNLAAPAWLHRPSVGPSPSASSVARMSACLLGAPRPLLPHTMRAILATTKHPVRQPSYALTCCVRGWATNLCDGRRRRRRRA